MPAQNPSSIVVDAVGVPIRIDLSGLSAPDRDAVVDAWDAATVHAVDRADATVSPVRSEQDDEMLSGLSSAVTRAAIAARTGTLWMLHAAGLAAPDGGVIALVGRSGAGKTTAARALAPSWGYVSDETIGVDGDGRVHAYLKPLSIISGGRPFKEQHSPVALGLRPLPSAPLRVRRFVVLDRRTAPTPARLVPLDLPDALVALAPHSSALAALPRPLNAVSDLLVKTGGALRAEYHDAEDLVPLVSGLMTGRPGGMLGPTTVGDDALPAVPTRARADTAAIRYRRVAVVDSLVFSDGRRAVLTAEPDGRGILRILGAAASIVWRAAADATRDEMLDAATRGRPDEEASRSIDSLLAQLVEAGLLRIAV